MSFGTRLVATVPLALAAVLAVGALALWRQDRATARELAVARLSAELAAAARNGAMAVDAATHLKISRALDATAPEWLEVRASLVAIAAANGLTQDLCVTFANPSADLRKLRYAVMLHATPFTGKAYDVPEPEQELLRELVSSKRAVAVDLDPGGPAERVAAIAPIVTTGGEITGLLRLERALAPTREEIASRLSTARRKTAAWVLAAAVLSGLVAAQRLQRRVAAPLHRVLQEAGAVAPAVSPDTAGDELARLSSALAALRGRYEGMARNARGTSATVATLTGRLAESARTLSGDVATQSRAADHTSAFVVKVDRSAQLVSQSSGKVTNLVIETTASIEEMMAQVREIDRSATSLGSSTSVTASAIQEMGANIAEVAQNADKLSEQVADASVAVEQMGRSIGNVDRSSRDLLGAAGATSDAIARAMDSIREVEQSAQKSETLAQVVVADAENGRARVRSTIEGMQGIRQAITEVGQVIGHLEQSSLAIDQILDLIEKVAQQTNVLALNAALIAAHAGEEGKAFGVVAAKIRELSASTSERTRDIGRLVVSVRGDVTQANAMSQRAQQAMERGSAYAAEASAALDKILESAREASHLSQGIARATVGQLQAGVQIAEAMDRVRGFTGDISRATEEEGKVSVRLVETMDSLREKATLFKRATVELRTGSVQIVSAIDNVSNQAREISRATAEQARGGKAISRAVAEMEQAALDLTNAASDQSRDSKQAVDAVVEIGEIVGRNSGRVQEIEKAVTVLLGESQTLLKDVASLTL